MKNDDGTARMVAAKAQPKAKENVVYDAVLDAEGNMTTDENGNRVYEEKTVSEGRIGCSAEVCAGGPYEWRDH